MQRQAKKKQKQSDVELGYDTKGDCYQARALRRDTGREKEDNALRAPRSHHLDFDVVDLPNGRPWAKCVLYLDRLWGDKMRVEQLLKRTRIKRGRKRDQKTLPVL